MHDSFDVAVIRDWATNALGALGETRAEIDALNVFPVPDGDTGTNLFLTAEAAADAVEAVIARSASDSPASGDYSVAEVSKAFAHGALMGARGNSGVITSQILRGFADVLAKHGADATRGADVLAEALTRASDLAYASVGDPKEGTILSVARAAALAATQAVEAKPKLSLADTCKIAATGAKKALALTTEQLEALRVAGVVDAGGRGYVVLIESLVEAITGVHRKREKSRIANALDALSHHTLSYGGPAYEVMFLLDAHDKAVPAMREALAGLGDSLVVVGGDGLWNIHVHVDDIGAAIEAGIAAGRPYRINVTHLEEAESLRKSGRDSTEPADTERDRKATGSARKLIAVAHGPGIADLLREAGVTVVMAGPGRRPSTAELLDGVARSGAPQVILLPSDRDTAVVAEVVAAKVREDGLRAAVIPTRSIVQTLAAVAVHNPNAHFDDDVVAMGREAGATRYGALTIASKQAVTSAGVCQIGDVLGLVDGVIVEIGKDIATTAARILERMLGGGAELVTIVSGEDADQPLIDSVVAAAAKGRGGIDIEVVKGGQPLWPLIIGAE